MRSIKMLSCLSALAVLTVGGIAGAQENQSHMGAPNQIAIDSDFQVSFNKDSYSGPQSDRFQSTKMVLVRPSLDYFVTRNVSIGAAVTYQWIKQENGYKNTQLGFGPRVGYFFGINETLGVWPKVGLSYHRWSSEGGGADEQSGHRFTVDAFVPLTITPVEHFYFGIGPSIHRDIASKFEGEDYVKTSSVGVMSQVGGYF